MSAKLHCDCLTDCGDDPLLKSGKAAPCAYRLATEIEKQTVPRDTYDKLLADHEYLKALVNTPETHDWFKGVELEAAHQIDRFASMDDAGKEPADWFWLIGYLAGKALAACIKGDKEKAKHHTISSAAALLNWHRAISGIDHKMRPGIAKGKQ